MDNVIELREVSSRYRRDKCQHTRIEIDEVLSVVSCSTCKVGLNPIYILIRMAREESRWAQELDAKRALDKKLDAKIRCKCEHCGKFTRVHGR